MLINPGRFLVFLALLLVLSGGHITISGQASKQKQPSKAELARARQEDLVKISIDKFVTCMYASADEHAKGKAEPIDIADAALGECSREQLSYRDAITNYLVSLVSRRGEPTARAQAKTHAAETTAETQRMVISRVIRARDAAKNEPPK